MPNTSRTKSNLKRFGEKRKCFVWLGIRLKLLRTWNVCIVPIPSDPHYERMSHMHYTNLERFWWKNDWVFGGDAGTTGWGCQSCGQSLFSVNKIQTRPSILPLTKIQEKANQSWQFKKCKLGKLDTPKKQVAKLWKVNPVRTTTSVVWKVHPFQSKTSSCGKSISSKKWNFTRGTVMMSD